MDTLLHAALSNAAVVAVLAPIVAVFGRVSRRPALVHSLWLLVLLKLFTPPLWPLSVSWLLYADGPQVTADSTGFEPKLPVEPAETVSPKAVPEEATDDMPQESAAPGIAAAAPLEPTSPVFEEPAATKAPSPPDTSTAAVTATALSWRAWLGAIWLSGSGLWLALAGCRVYRFHRLLRFTQRAPPSLQIRVRRLAERLGLAACPDVWVVPAPVSPMLWALAGAPRLLVPRSLLERLTEEQWDTLLAHELAHLRRGDHWVRFLELACLGLYWWHPVVWWARRELREAEEQCCDAWVVWALPGAAEIYASTLVEAVTYLSSARTVLPLAASGIGHMHLLKRRLTMIMRGTTPRALSAAGTLAVLGLAAVLLPLYPSWARTDQRPEGAGDQQAPGGTTTTGGPGSGIEASPSPGTQDDASPSSGTQDDPAPGETGGRVGRGGGRGRVPYGPNNAVRRSSEGREYPETVEDAQDEMDLLQVQLHLRSAERREVGARLGQAQRDKERLSRLLKGNAVDPTEVERAITEVEVQEARLAAKDAQIKEAELRLKQAQRRLARLRNEAPQPGGVGIGPRGGGAFGTSSGGGGRFGPGSAPGGTSPIFRSPVCVATKAGQGRVKEHEADGC